MNFADCLIALSGLCLADPSNLQVETGISRQLSGDMTYTWAGKSYGGGTLGTAAIVLEQPLARGFSYRLGFEHRSLLDTAADRGEERWFFNLTWRPFR